MKNCITVNSVIIKGNSIVVRYTVSKFIEKFFRSNEFVVEYSLSVEQVPIAIAIIPFVCNLLPFIWIKDCELILPAIDQTFYRQIDIIKESYQKMYPMLHFQGVVKANEIHKISYNAQKSLCFFSGGVDAFSTLLHHISEKPVLFTIWGADIKYSDEQSWNIVKKQNEATAELFSLDFFYCKTNFREFYNNDLFNVLVVDSNDDWWHGFQHGMGLIGHAAPLSFAYGIKNLYVASSYAVENYKCASDPTIDNNVIWSNIKTYHDQYMYTRQDKVHDICAYARNENKYPYLRVCWQSHSASNCGYCEKCMRTVYGLIAEGENPNYYGFHIDPNLLKEKIIELIKSYRFPVHNISYWVEIQDRFKKNKSIIGKEYLDAILWIDSIDFAYFCTRKYALLRRLHQLPYLVTHLGYFISLLKNRIFNKK